MWTSMFLLIFQGISGGVAGYITNKYAVNMLFKEYTPLKLGGVIKKKKEKFIEEISELVERDIINAETLKAELSNKDLNGYIEQIADTFFKTALKDTLGNTKVCDVADFSNSTAKSEEFVIKNLNMILPELLDNIFNNINLEDILTKDQISKIVSSSYDLLTQDIEDDDTLREFISKFYNENSNITLSHIFSEEMQRNFVVNINEHINKIIREDILDDEDGCKLFFDKVLSTINIDLTLVKLQGLIGDYEINQFVSVSEKEAFSLKLFSKVNEFINSQKGKQLIINLMDEILLIGKDIDFTVYEILPLEMEKSLTYFIEAVIPKIMPYISDWISGNESSFDKIIEDSIDEAIGDMDGNIKKLIISKVRSAIMGDISSENNIVKKIITYINDSFDGDSYNKITHSIISYLKNKKIKHLLKSLEKQDLISSEKLAELIIKQFDLYGKSLFDDILKSQFSKKIHNVVKFDLVKLFNSNLKPILYKNIFNNKDKLSEKLNKLVEEFIILKSNEIFSKKLSKLLTYEQISNISDKFEKSTTKLFEKNSSLYKRKIEDFLSLKVRNVKLSSTLEEYKQGIVDFIVDNLVVLHKETVDKYKDYELRELITKYFDKTILSDLLINKGYPMLINNLPNLLDGNIKKFAKSNLEKYDEDEICDIVQGFMGDQLKPLSVFGGVLGVIVGVIYQLIYPNSIGMYGFPSSLLNILISCVIMAGIGYITNVIALWMIFHPYKENKILAKIPFLKKFALGYIPAHKNQFAIGMAKLIDEELLNKEEINKAFKSQENTIESLLMNLVTNNNYQVLIKFIRDKKQELSKYIYKRILNYCNDSSYLSKRISKAITNSEFTKFIKKDDVLSIAPKLIENLKNIKNSLVIFIEGKLSEEYKINDILPESVSVEIREYIRTQIEMLFKEKISNIKNKDFANEIIGNYSNYYDLETRKSGKDIFSEEYIDSIKNNMEIEFKTYIFNDFKIYSSNFVKQFLCNELDENKNISSMLNGKVKTIVDNNIYLLINYLIDRLINYTQDNEYKLVLTVQEAIKNELNFFEKMAYGTFGGDDIAEKAVSIIVNEKLPIMIKDETDNIINISKIALNDSIYPIEISILKIKADEINTEMLFDNIFKNLSDSAYAKRDIHNTSNLILDSLMSTPIIEYLEAFNLNSLDLVYKKFYNEVTIIKEDIYNNINVNISDIAIVLSEFLDEKIITSLFDSHDIDIFKGINLKNIDDSVKNIINLIESSKESKKSLTQFLEKFYDNTYSKLKIEQIIDSDILSVDIKKIINSIFNNESFNENNIKSIEKIIKNTIDNNLNFISYDTKDYITDKILQAGLGSISEHIVPILQEVNLKNITNKQIELLNPKEIDVLFTSFAGDFFNKLRIYGVFGFVFGINVGLSIILYAIDWKYSRISLEKDE